MIRVLCNGTSLSLQGHAGSAPYGQDLICAAVTALVYALGARLKELEEQDGFEKPLVIRLEPGDAQICAIAKAEYQAEVMADFRLICSGLKLLQIHYPNQIEVTVR